MPVPASLRDLLLASFRAAVAAADPARVVPPHLPAPPRGRTLVLGGGKAAAGMAAAVEANWPAHAPLGGLVVTRYRHSVPTQRIEVVEASHPLPDGRGEIAALRMLDAARTLGEDDLLLALISGGGSSLLAAPVEGVTLEELRTLTRALLGAGADINAINTVRKHLTRLSGGQLARAANGARVCALILSDVVGDDPADIASGPCAPDPTTAADASALLDRFGLVPPASIAAHLARIGTAADTARPGETCFSRVDNRIVASARASLSAGASVFEAAGIPAIIVSERVSGEAAEAARHHAALARASTRRPLALVSGGETTVRLRPQHGRGGRNTEFLLALACEETLPDAWALACDTDGIDGSEDNAGAWLTPDTLLRARNLGLDAQAHLLGNDSHGFFAALGDLVVTGPTRTNVNDYRAILLL